MSLVLKTPEQAGYPPCIPCITILPPPIPGREGAARYPPCITVLSPPNTWAGGSGKISSLHYCPVPPQYLGGRERL